jgi:hypothetical protein
MLIWFLKKWIVTADGEKFIQDEKILRIEEEEEFEFLIDGISREILSVKENPTERIKLGKYLEVELKLAAKSPELLENKFQPFG